MPLSIRIKQLAAISICISLYWCARLPEISETQRVQLAKDFAFKSYQLPDPLTPLRTQRIVNSQLRHISGWISSIGSSICLGDLDGDGLANDICLVDPRTDEMFVMPVPGSETRYKNFPLSFAKQKQDSPKVRDYDPQRMAPTGARLADLNEDGFLDVVAYYWGRPPLAFLALPREPGSPLNRSQYRAVEIVPKGNGWYSACLTVADVNSDGHQDLIVGNYDPENSPKLGEGGDVSNVMQDSMSRAYNGGRNRFLLWQQPEKGDEDGVKFVDTDSGLEPYLLTGWTLAVGAADLDGDGLPEIYFANDFGPDRLLWNRSKPEQLAFELLEGVKHFTTPNSKVLGRDSFKGMGIDFADINRDRIPDLFVSNIAGSWSLEESNFMFVSTGESSKMQKGVAPFEDRSEELGVSRGGWGWDVKFGDFNNDGTSEIVQAAGFLRGSTNRWPELHELAMGNDQLLSNPLNWPTFSVGDNLSGDQHNPFYVRNGDGRFYDIADLVHVEGPIDLAVPHVTRGIATADCDGDGDLDFAIANQWGPSGYFQNQSSQQQGSAFQSVVLDIALAADDRMLDKIHVAYEFNPSVRRTPAIGAVVLVHARDGDQTAFVDGGNGHSGARSPQLHFGLGAQSKYGDLVEVEIKWRDRAGRSRQEAISIKVAQKDDKLKIAYVTLPRL